MLATVPTQYVLCNITIMINSYKHYDIGDTKYGSSKTVLSKYSWSKYR